MKTAFFTLAAALLAFQQDAGQAIARAQVAAHCQDQVLGLAEYDALALNRHAHSETGRAALKHLLYAWKFTSRVACRLLPLSDCPKQR